MVHGGSCKFHIKEGGGVCKDSKYAEIIIEWSQSTQYKHTKTPNFILAKIYVNVSLKPNVLSCLLNISTAVTLMKWKKSSFQDFVQFMTFVYFVCHLALEVQIADIVQERAK